jgi:hypothetical protein
MIDSNSPSSQTLRAALIAALCGAMLTPAVAFAYPASYWTTVDMKVPVSHCVHAAGKAVKATGLGGITATDMATGGHTPSTRGYIVCVQLPKAGACNGDGATAVVVTAGSDAKKLLGQLTKNLKVPVLIDCGAEGNPVNK